jgi:rhodanese-related sulfurtransferase
MVERGWKKVTNMKGGFNAWSAAGYPSVKGEK